LATQLSTLPSLLEVSEVGSVTVGIFEHWVSDLADKTIAGPALFENLAEFLHLQAIPDEWHHHQGNLSNKIQIFKF